MKDQSTTTTGFTPVENRELAELRLAASKNTLLTEIKLEKALAEQIHREMMNDLEGTQIYGVGKVNMRKAVTRSARCYLADPVAANRLIDAHYGGDRMAYLMECCLDAAGYKPWDSRWNHPELAERFAPRIGRARPRRSTLMNDAPTMH